MVRFMNLFLMSNGIMSQEQTTLPTVDHLWNRGLLASDLKASELWWNGPNFLRLNIEQWPTSTEEDDAEIDLPEMKDQAQILIVSIPEVEFTTSILELYSSLIKLQEVMAYVKRAIYNFRHPQERKTGPLLVPEREEALLACVRLAQRVDFPDEIAVSRQIEN